MSTLIPLALEDSGAVEPPAATLNMIPPQTYTFHAPSAARKCEGDIVTSGELAVNGILFTGSAV